MADLPQQDTIIQYDADGITDAYNFAYLVPKEADIAVYVTLSGEEPIPSDDIKMLNVDYEVSFNIDPITGGTVTFLTGKIPPDGSTVTLSRDVQASLDVEFADARTLNGQNLDDALDRLLLLIQQNKTYINSVQQRVLSYRVNAFEANSDIVANTQIPLLADNQIWVGSGDGVIAADLEQNPDVSVLRAQLENNSPGTDGARIVGYYDASSGGMGATTVQAYLASLPAYIQETIQNNTQIYAEDEGTLNAMVITLSSTLSGYQAGQLYIVKPANTNTSSSVTLDVDGNGAELIKVVGTLVLQPGDIVADVNAFITFDGTNMQLLNPQTMLSRKFAGTYMTMSGGVSIPALSTVKIPFNTVVFDTNSWCNTGSNRIVPTLAGYVRVNSTVHVNDSGVTAVQGDIEIQVHKNGSLFATMGGAPVTGFSTYIGGDCLVPVNGTTDYIEIFGVNENNVRAMTFGSTGIFQSEFIGR